MVEVGINVTPSSVFTSSLAFTNWLGNRAPCLIVEDCPQLNRTRGGINQIVEGQKFSRGYLGLLCPIESIDHEPLPMSHLLLHLAEIVFRDSKNNGDGLLPGQSPPE